MAFYSLIFPSATASVNRPKIQPRAKIAKTIIALSILFIKLIPPVECRAGGALKKWHSTFI
jgi:hypothetical protein